MSELGRTEQPCTAINGAYTLTLPAGAFNLGTGFWTGSVYQQPSRSLTVAGDMTGVDFAVGTGCCAVYGYVTDESGKPVANAMVTAGTGYTAWTNDCGGYRLPLNRPGTYTVSVSKAGYGATSSNVTMPPNRGDLDFRLGRLSGPDSLVSVLARDASGQPLPLASVSIVADPGGASTWSGYADLVGRISASVPPGGYRITASRTCYLGSTQSIMVPPATTTEVTLYRLASRISGRVTDSNGAAVYRARVTATGTAGTLSATTDSNGEYTLKISSGVWDISAQSASDCSSALAAGRRVTVPPEQAEVNLVLLPDLPHIYLPLVIQDR